MVYTNKNIINYEESSLYNNPFLYYSQSHIVGIDINQDNYPNILGLCIIDDKTLYTTVAQAIFRLRKLNMGHEINFYVLNILNTTPKKIYEMLKTNDTNNKNSKHNLLIYQTIKSIVRKNNSDRSTDMQFSNFYKEKTKYYFFDNKMPGNTENLIDGILSYDLVKDMDMFKEISKLDVLTRLVYNIDTLSHDITTETENQKTLEHQNEFSIVTNEVKSSRFYPPVFYVLKNNIFDTITENLESVSVKLYDRLYCLPNIFVNVSNCTYEEEIINPIYFVYIDTKNKLLIIPEYMLENVYNKFVVFDKRLQIINTEFQYKIKDNILFINEIMEYPFIKLFSMKSEIVNCFDMDILSQVGQIEKVN